MDTQGVSRAVCVSSIFPRIYVLVLGSSRGMELRCCKEDI